MLGLGSTYGLWFLCSILFLDPWHMFNSFVQYMFLVPFWVNVLQTYAMCNTHDVTWGTKGDNTGSHDLGGAKKAAGGPSAGGAKAQVELELPDATKADEANKTYNALLGSLQGGMAKPEPGKVDANTKRDDDFKLFRTNVVLTWVFTNFVFVAVLTNPAIQDKMYSGPTIIDPATGQEIPDPNSLGFSGYLDFLFWVTTFFALVKFIGAVWYLIAQQLFDRKEDPEDAHIGEFF